MATKMVDIKRSFLNLPAKKTYLLFSILFFFVTIYSASYVSENVAVYFIFSFSTFLMMSVCVFQKQFIGPLFLGFFLMMGLWFKATVHFLQGTILNEPVGNFNFSTQSWSEVLSVASIGMLGLTLAIFGLRWKLKKTESGRMDSDELVEFVPVFYIRYRKFIYALGMAAAFLIPVLNLKWGIHQVGLNPKTILLWPLNTVISYLINIGLVMSFTVLLACDLKLKKSPIAGFGLVCITSFLTSVSALSRGMFILQILPYFVSLVFFTKVDHKKYILSFLFFLFLVGVSISATNTVRARVYPVLPKAMTERQIQLSRLEVVNGGIDSVREMIKKGREDQIPHLETLEKEKIDLQKKIFGAGENSMPVSNDPAERPQAMNPSVQAESAKPQIKQDADRKNIFTDVANLIMNRFVGIEGLMVLQSRPDKSFKLWRDAVFEKRTLDSPTAYQNLSKSSYRYTDMQSWQFASLPGPVAFFYYGGSSLFVFTGMLCFGCLIVMAEIFVLRITHQNLFLTSLLISTLANSMAQFGLSPRQELVFYSLIFLNLIFLWRLSLFKSLNDGGAVK